MAVQLAHTLAVAPTYYVGSFDDDANYLMAAHVLASGGGLTSTMPSGATVVANYLPGYPALLVPLIWVFGPALWTPRALSTLCVAALYPLLWAWMARRGVKPWYRVAVLGLLAINTVMATYSTMVMAEAPFLVVLVLTLFAIDRWDRQPGLPRARRSRRAPGRFGVAEGGRDRPRCRPRCVRTVAPALVASSGRERRGGCAAAAGVDSPVADGRGDPR